MVRLSEKHGVNPTIPLCFYCMKHKNEVLLMGRLPDDAEAPRNVILDKEPCDDCKLYMEMGIIFISVDEEKTGNDRDNPWRTGGWCVLSEEYVRRVITTDELREHILHRRMAFIPDEVWDKLGLPRGPLSSVDASGV